jgi:hypothetical protein
MRASPDKDDGNSYGDLKCAIRTMAFDRVQSAAGDNRTAPTPELQSCIIFICPSTLIGSAERFKIFWFPVRIRGGVPVLKCYDKNVPLVRCPGYICTDRRVIFGINSSRLG